MLAWRRPETMSPNSNVRRQSRPPHVQQEEVAASGTVMAAVVEVEAAETFAAAAGAVATAPALRARFRSICTTTPI